MSTLNVENLTAGYGQSMVIHDVSVRVEEGEIVGIVGPNGSGKSTLLKSVFGLTRVSSGKIIFSGTDITHTKPSAIVKQGIGYVPQVSNVFSKLTVRENMEMGAIARSDRSSLKDNFDQALNFFPSLREREEQKAGVLSGGERQMLAISRALIAEPKLLLLDEPAASLSPKTAGEVFSKIQELNEQGRTIVIVEQNVKRTLSISKRAYVFVSGRKVLEGNAADILAMDIGKIFLGKIGDAQATRGQEVAS